MRPQLGSFRRRRWTRRRKRRRLRDTIKHRWRNRLRGWRCGNGSRRTRTFAPPATPSTATAAAMVLVGLGSRGVGFCWRLLENRFLLTIVQFWRGFRALLFGEFCDNGFRRGGQLRHGLADGNGRGLSRRRWNGGAQPSQRFLRLLLPLRPPETLGSSREPASRLGKRAGFFMDLCQFKRDHCVASTFIQRRELAGGIRAGSSLADTRLNLSPIAHWPVLYQRGARGTRAARGKATYVFSLSRKHRVAGPSACGF